MVIGQAARRYHASLWRWIQHFRDIVGTVSCGCGGPPESSGVGGLGVRVVDEALGHSVPVRDALRQEVMGLIGTGFRGVEARGFVPVAKGVRVGLEGVDLAEWYFLSWLTLKTSCTCARRADSGRSS